ncbi:hypothetical protein [Leptospira levettii]|uniref:hypothetical protein n=1 Tax=Leptospira levettii TaxID=2023178 RepID=UPI001083F7A0|nr:hypothetical protein [Leptospira levettii]MCW7509758.1 hypothetical protein [Leptospira levettii]MCW7520845.1 hypothetical protein [Leptospira levettii]TGK92795.1 hypothetical protein EHQ34_17800 [Leptospira levettii]
MSTIIANNPSNYNSSYEDIFVSLNKYTQISILEKISEFLWKFYKNHSIGNPDINILSLNIIMITLLDSRFNTSIKKPEISYQEFREINLMANAVSDLEDETQIDMWYIQTHYNQIVLNPNSPFYKMVLFMLLFCKVDETPETKLLIFFKEYFGYTGEDIGTALWTIFSFFTSNQRLKNLEQSGIKDLEILKSLLKKFGKNLNEIRKTFNESPKYKSTDWRAKFNPFRDFPIIVESIDNEFHYFIPSPHFMFLLHTENLYYFIFQHFLEKEKEHNKNNKDPGKNPFSAEFGKSIENVVYKITKNELGLKREVIPEFKFKNNNGSDAYSADLHIVENKGSNLCLIQIKGKRVRLSSQGGNIKSYLEDIEKSLIYGIEQNFYLITQPEFLNVLLERCSWKYNKNKITFLIIYVEGFYDITYPKIKEYIDNRISEIKAKYQIDYQIDVAFVSLEQYIRLVEWSSSDRRSISDKIKDYCKYLNNPSKEKNLGSEGFSHSFDEFIRVKSKGQTYPKSFSKKIYDNFIKEIQARIIPHSA